MLGQHSTSPGCLHHWALPAYGSVPRSFPPFQWCSSSRRAQGTSMEIQRMKPGDGSNKSIKSTVFFRLSGLDEIGTSRFEKRTLNKRSLFSSFLNLIQSLNRRIVGPICGTLHTVFPLLQDCESKMPPLFSLVFLSK